MKITKRQLRQIIREAHGGWGEDDHVRPDYEGGENRGLAASEYTTPPIQAKIWTTPEGWDIKVGDKVKITTAQTGKSRHLSVGRTGTVSDIGWGNRGTMRDPARQLYLDLMLDDDPNKDPMLNSISTQDVELIPEGVARKMKITRRQLRRIIREATDYERHQEVHWKEGDLVRQVDFEGDEWGGDYEKTVGDQIGQVIEIDKDPDGTQYTVLFPDGTMVMDTFDSFEAAK